jgi:hypothetical protein
MSTVKYVSEFFGKEERIVQNTSTSNSRSEGSGKNVNDSISFNVQEKSILRTQDVSELDVGEFAGKIIGRKPTAFYKAQFRRWRDVTGLREDEYEVPPFAGNVDIMRNKERILNNIYQLKQTLTI